MADGRYERDGAGWSRIALGGDVLAACMAEAERGRAFAEAEAPVDSGRYASSFRVEAATVNFGSFGPRAAAELWNDAPWAATVEFGSNPSVSAGSYHPGNNSQRVLQRTAEYLVGN